MLASASPARLSTLRNAGLNPEVIVSGVDESGVEADSVAELTGRLAQLKAEAVFATVGADGEGDAEGHTIVIGCDSLLALDEEPFGKPGSPSVAIDRWRRMRGRSGVLHTGHHLIVRRPTEILTRSAVASTTVHFAGLTDAEIEAYVATGEPLQVAGAFTVDGLGGPFVTSIEGDHHNVVGISLPVIRVLLAGAGIDWPLLWASRSP
ncbi:MAG TPA: Maf family protein [Propionibacteriaceae bacterium]